MEPSYRLSVAPMIEWTDRHCRYMMRLISKRTLLYTEMIAAAAVLRGPRARLLDFDASEHPLALQLGGSNPAELAEAVKIAADWGYDEINLNVGCPSDKVQSGCFGAVLMRDPDLVRRICAAMIEAADAAGGPEITVKCRIGVDEDDPAERLPAFIDTVAQAGVERFIVHARKAWLSGLSPKDNRTIPPLDYDLVRRIKERRPQLKIILNGGLESLGHAAAETRVLDGAMIGRAAYHDPMAILGGADEEVFADASPLRRSPQEVVALMTPYIEARLAEGLRLNAITRHMLNLFAGQPGARAWRREISQRAHKPGAGVEVLKDALAHVETHASLAAS